MPPGTSNNDMSFSEIQHSIDRTFDARKEYFEAKLIAADVESKMRFDRMMQGLADLSLRLETAIQTMDKDRDRVFETLQGRFIEVHYAEKLVDEKNNLRFKTLEDDINNIIATYARQESLDRSTNLAKESVNIQFQAVEREYSQIAERNKAAWQLTQQKFSEADTARADLDGRSKERFETMLRHTDMQVAGQTQATRLVSETMSLRFAEIDKATTLATDALNKRLEAMNHVGAQMDKQAQSFPVRAELDALRNELSGRLTVVDTSRITLADRVATIEKNGVTRLESESVSKRITEIEAYKNTQEGKTVAQSTAIGVIVTIVNVIIGIALHFIR